MDNKQQINKLRDMAELAQASYGYFHYVDNKFDIKDEDKIVTFENVLDITYKNSKIIDERGFKIGKLDGDFSPLQAKQFFSRYDLLIHQPNTESSFSATLFYDKQKDEFIIGFRGTEVSFKDLKATWETALDTTQDLVLSLNGNLQSSFLLEFLEQVNKIIKNKHKRITFVGHSLGGYLAVVAMQFCDTIDRTLCTDFNQIKFSASKVYTFNSPTIDGIDNMLMRFLANLLGNNIVEQILNPEKIVCVFDNGGVEIIASAQYGASNALDIYTGKNDQSIKPLVNTLYFYSYLLELKENEDKIIKNNSLK
ncbi:lipase family protein [Campylobacter coli]